MPLSNFAFPGGVAAPLRAGIAEESDQKESDQNSSHGEEQHVLTPNQPLAKFVLVLTPASLKRLAGVFFT